jgi:hypothetical protein
MCRGADNPPGLKPVTEAADVRALLLHGRGASPSAEKPRREPRWSGGECECRHE